MFNLKIISIFRHSYNKTYVYFEIISIFRHLYI